MFDNVVQGFLNCKEDIPAAFPADGIPGTLPGAIISSLTWEFSKYSAAYLRM